MSDCAADDDGPSRTLVRPPALRIPGSAAGERVVAPVLLSTDAPRRPAQPTLFSLLTIGESVSLVVGIGTAVWISGLRPALLVGALSVVVLVLAPHPRWRFTLSVLDDLPVLVGATGSATLVVAAGIALFDKTFLTTERVLDAMLAGLAVLLVLVVGRAATYAVAHRLRRRGIGAARAVIVGTGSAGTTLGRILQNDHHHGVDVIGFVDDTPSPANGRVLLGSLVSLPNVIREHQVDVVLIAFGPAGCHALVDPIRSIRRVGCEVYVIPRLYELHDRAAVTDLVNGVPLVRLRRLAFRSMSWQFKRVMDVVAASLGLIVAAPVLLLVSIAVRIETGPGVIFKQLRIGRDGRPFTLYKFRSLQPVGNEDATRWSIDGDARVGPVGTFIRSTSLDELPQLMNVLRGDMSLVGPRPERPHFVSQFERSIPGYRHRHRMPAGLTGLAAVNGLRGDTGIKERAHLDNIYAESWSLWLDIKIIIRTAGQLFAPRRQRRKRRRQEMLG